MARSIRVYMVYLLLWHFQKHYGRLFFVRLTLNLLRKQLSCNLSLYTVLPLICFIIRYWVVMAGQFTLQEHKYNNGSVQEKVSSFSKHKTKNFDHYMDYYWNITLNFMFLTRKLAGSVKYIVFGALFHNCERKKLIKLVRELLQMVTLINIYEINVLRHF